jgi:myo-inositol-1(or 4)-monophosphatase
MKEPTLELLESLALKAGEILRQGQEQGFSIAHKGEIDLVTEIDHRAEAFLLAEIQRLFPSHHIVAEETGEVQGDCECAWHVDPVDGTVNYAHGVPFFAVSIAYESRGQLRFGVVYDPMRDECYSAARGQGARLNGRLLRVSSQTDLDQSLLVTGFSYDIRTNPDNNLDHFVRFSLCTQGVRRLGSAALDLCYVAAGRFDGFWEVRIKSYDIAAGGLIAEEAGARVTNLHGSPDYLTPPISILAAPPAVHAQMLAVLHSQQSA